MKRSYSPRIRSSTVTQEVLHRGDHGREHLVGRPLGVDDADPLGLGGRELVVGAGDRLEERGVLELESVGCLAAAGLPRAPGGGIDAQQQRAVGDQAAGAEVVDRAHRVDAERPARRPGRRATSP